MRFFFFFWLVFSPIISLSAQQVITDSLSHDGLTRTYLIYIPDTYDGSTSVPLLLNFHGYTSNSTEQMFYGDFRAIADTANFIIVHPQGTELEGETHFNVGGWTIGSTVDDVGFTASLLDELQASYNIDANRIYSTGMSNGGYMSFLLACQLSDRIAAIASVTGSMTPQTFDNCNPQHPTPILQIHGTADEVVPYEGAIWTKSIEDVLKYWTNYNNCESDPLLTELPDVNAQDGSTVSHFVYGNGDKQTVTEHFKVNGGGHTWAGTAFVFSGTNYDINASLEVWQFLSKYNLEALQQTTTSIDPFSFPQPILSIYPNPTASDLVLVTKQDHPSMNYELWTSTGKRVLGGILSDKQSTVDMRTLPTGVYFLRIDNYSYRVLKTD